MSLGMRRLSKAKPNMAPPAVMCPLTAAMVGIPSVRMPQRNKNKNCASCSFPAKQWASCAADTCAPSQHHPLHWVKWHAAAHGLPAPTQQQQQQQQFYISRKHHPTKTHACLLSANKCGLKPLTGNMFWKYAASRNQGTGKAVKERPRRAKQMPACSISRLLFIVVFSVV